MKTINRKHVLRALAFACAIAATPGCLSGRTLEKHGVEFRKARTTERGVLIGYLDRDQTLAGRRCRAGWVHVHENGVPAGFTAAEDIPFGTDSIPAGTWVFQDRAGAVTICAFPRDVTIQGRVCRGGRGGSKGVQAAFYPSGALKEFFARDPVVIDGIPCNANVFQAGIQLHENGRLRRAVVAEDAWLQGRLLRKGTRVHLSPEGQLLSRP